MGTGNWGGIGDLPWRNCIFWRGRNLRSHINFLLSMSFSKQSLKNLILELGKEERLNSSSNFEQNFELTFTLEFNSYWKFLGSFMQFVPSQKWAKWVSRDFFGCFFLLALCKNWISKKSSWVSSSSLVIHSVLGISVANPWPPNPFVLSIWCWKSNLADFYWTPLKFLESGFWLETCICKFKIGFLWALPIFIKKKKISVHSV